jgi:excisionase family DNA binding protein
MEYRIIEMLKELKAIVLGRQPQDGWMDIRQVAEYSSMSRSSIRRSCQEGRLRYSDKHGKFLFRKSDVERWLTG